MKLLFIKTDDSTITYGFELMAIKTGLMFCDQLTVVSSNLRHMQALVQIDTMPEKLIIEWYKELFSATPEALKADWIDAFYKSVMLARRTIGKNKHWIIQLERQERVIQNIKKDVVMGLVTIMMQSQLESVVDFARDKSLVINDLKLSSIGAEEELTRIIIDSFSDDDVLHYFDVSLAVQYKKGKGEGVESIVFDENDGSIIEEDLFVIPSVHTLTHSQLKIIKNEFDERLAPFYEGIMVLKKEMSSTIMSQETIVSIYRQLDELCAPMAESIEKTIADNSYFQQILNSSKDPTMLEMYLGISTIRTAIGFYEKCKIISEESKTYILNVLSKSRDLNTCCLFLYYNIKMEGWDEIMDDLSDEDGMDQATNSQSE
ncbi:MAG: hypothetical protein WCL14_03455 [Bacteroidota bacterium]